MGVAAGARRGEGVDLGVCDYVFWGVFFFHFGIVFITYLQFGVDFCFFRGNRC